MGGEPNTFMISAPVLSTIAFAITAFFNFLANQDADDLGWGIYKNNTGDISDRFFLEVTPAGWTFSIWGFIYAYQILFLLYWLTLLCRKNRTTNEPLYMSPVFMSPWIAVFYVLNMAGNVGWTFAWDRQNLPIAFVLLVLTTVTLYFCLGISFYYLVKSQETMLKQGLEIEIRLVIGFVHNALGMYAMWVSIASVLNFSMILVYEEDIGLKQSLASTIFLAVVAMEIVIFIYLDQVMLEKHMRYLFTPYIVLIVALIGSIEKNYDSDNPNSIFSVGLLTICAFAAVMKIILVIYRTRRYPLYDTRMEAL